MTQEIIINPTEYGIEEKQANDLIGNLPQIIKERAVLESQFNSIITMDIEDIETTKRAKELRLLIKNNRTQGIIPWHKTTKDYFLRGGQFVDAIKRKEISVNERMENDLMEIEKHQERKEAERLRLLQEEREKMFIQYEYDGSGVDLANMDLSTFENLLLGAKTQFEDKQRKEREAEAERIRLEQIQKIFIERKEELYQFAPFHIDERLSSDTTEEEYLQIKYDVNAKKVTHDKEQEAIRLENERLKKEREELEAKQKAEELERERLAKIESDKRAKAAAAQKIIDDKLKKEKAEAEAKAAAAQKIIDDRLKREAAAAKAEEERKRQILLAGDKAILKDWISAIMIPSTITAELNPKSEQIRQEILKKFNGFKSWAIGQIETIK